MPWGGKQHREVVGPIVSRATKSRMDYLQEHPEERTAAEKKQLDAVRRATSRQGRNSAAVVNPTAATQQPKATYGDKAVNGLFLKPLTAQDGKDSKNNQSNFTPKNEEKLKHNDQTLLDMFLPNFLKDNKPGSEPDDKELLDEDEEKQLEEIDNSSRLPHGKVKSNKTGYLHSR